MQSFKNRHLDTSRPVRIYRNLNRKVVTWSILQNGLVVAHANNITITKPISKINLSGQLRAKTTKTRNVHAFIEGYVCDAPITDTKQKIQYNPYIDGSFVSQKGTPIEKFNYVCFDSSGAHGFY